MLPASLKSTGRSYLSLFVLSLVGLASASLYNPAASLNERCYVIFILLLSFLYTFKLLGTFAKKLKSKQMVQHANPNTAAVVGVLLVMLTLSLIPPIVVFALQHLKWAERFCALGVLYSAILGVVIYAFSKAFASAAILFKRAIESISNGVSLLLFSGNLSSLANQMFRAARRRL